MRPRKTRTDLPPCVYLSHGAYYYVKHNKWHPLGRDKTQALIRYARLISEPQNGVTKLADRFMDDARNRPKPLKQSTMKQYAAAVDVIKSAFVEFDVSQVRPIHISQFMDHHRHTPNMANRMYTVLRQMFDIGVRTGQCETNPTISIRRFHEEKRKRYLTDAEFLAIRCAGNDTLKLIMDICYLTGQRISDILNIKIGDISDEGIRFVQQKTGKRILVSMTPDMAAVVAVAKRQHRHSTIYLLGQRDGRKRSYNGVRGLFDRAAEKAGVEDVTLHDIRAKAITDAKRQGLDPQALGGHSTEEMTNRYIRDRETIVAIGPSFRQPNTNSGK